MMEGKLENILIVDDQPSNIRLLSNMLDRQHYKVRKALNGKTAINAVYAEKPDLILLDIKMPEIDGYQVCQELKLIEQFKDIPIIFISALHDTSDKIKGFEVGGIDYVTKPFQEEEVLIRVQNQLTIKKQQKLLLLQEKTFLSIKEKLLVLQQEELKKEIKSRKKIENNLHQSKLLINSILDNSLDGIAALKAVRNIETNKIKNFSFLIGNTILANIFNQKIDDLKKQLFFKEFIEQISSQFFCFADFVNVVETGISLETKFTYQAKEKQKEYNLLAVKLDDGLLLNIRKNARVNE